LHSHLTHCLQEITGKHQIVGGKEVENPLRKSVIVPSKHEEVVLNYNIDEYYYIKVTRD
jgi:hypothetical protein